MIEFERRIQLRIVSGPVLEGSHVDAAALAEINPAAARQIAVNRAAGVGAHAKAPRHLARAGQLLTRLQGVAGDAKDKLCGELFANRDFAAFGEPESHQALFGQKKRGRPGLIAGCGELLPDRGEWEGDVKMRPFTRVAFNLNVPAVILDDAVTDGQPETGSLADLLGGEERVVNFREVFGRDAGAGIGE